MILLTQSLQEFLRRKGMLEELVLLDFGHTELLSEDIAAEYLEWVQTPEGMSYLKGGENYDEEYGRKIEKAMNRGKKMREILFRGKRADNGEWVCGYYSNLGSCSRITKEKVTTGEMGRIIECENIEVLPETVGQYTGLTDKNGKKIFEGDICLIHTSIVYQRGVVSYNPKTANFDIKGNGFVTDFYNYFGSDCEVIGNIHDNPELLKGGEKDE